MKFSYLAILLAGFLASSLLAAEPMKALIIDGQNNHGNWPTTTQMMKKYLVDSKLFEVDIATRKSKDDDVNFAPDFQKYAVVVSNYNGERWPAAVEQAFVEYVKGRRVRGGPRGR